MVNILRLSRFVILFVVAMLASCSAGKFVPDQQYMLNKVEIRSDNKEVNTALLGQYIRQKANSKWFSAFRIPLGIYALSGADTTKWLNRALRNMGEKPVIFDTLLARQTCDNLQSALQSLGYMHSEVTMQTKWKHKKVDVTYVLHPGEPYLIGQVEYDIQDDSIARLLNLTDERNQRLKKGMPFTTDLLNDERKRITRILTDNGYYRFHRDFIRYTADSVSGMRLVNLTLHLMKYRTDADEPERLHTRYTVRSVNHLSGDSGRIHLRQHVLENNTAIEAGKLYSSSALQRTYNNFGRLQIVRYTNIRFAETPDSNLLDCNIQISTNKPSTISFQPEGTNTAGDLGAAASLTYENRNLFRGGEILSVQLRGAFEAITGLEGYRDQNYVEYSLETKLAFPNMVAPFVKNSFHKRSIATSELSLAFDMQDRPEFHRRVFSTAWRYRWSKPQKDLNYRLDVLDLNYVYMPWISSTFKHDYLDSVSNRNAILRYNYEDLFITKIGFGVSYSNRKNAIRANFETAGNVMDACAHAFGMKQNEQGKYTLFNIAFAQYAKFDFDYTRMVQFDENNSLALHGGLGIAYPYGNSDVLPFEKRYFSGGANSVRGWNVRGLGPGRFKGTDGRIDFINQTGDMKLDLNAELRTKLFWKLNGAVFVDAGNIWTLRYYEEQDGGQFKLNEFYKQIAVAYGIGVRLNFDYFIMRADMGMKAVNPAYESHREHYPVFHPSLSRDFAFHFAVGLPF